MATTGGANIAVDGLVFGYDTGYPLVSGSSDAYKFNRGEPTENLIANTNLINVVDGTFTTNTTVDGVRILENNQVNNSHVMWNSATGFIVTCSAGAYITVSAEYKTDCTIRMRFRDNPYDAQYDIDGGNIATISEQGVDFNTNGEWKRYSLTAQTATANPDLWWYLVDYRTNNEFGRVEIRNWQIEVKSHATPFTTGTRSASGSLIDLTRTTDIDLSNVSFDSNAQMTFDGTDDRATYTTPHDDSVTELTYELVFKGSRGTDYTYILHNNGQDITTGNSFCTFGWLGSTDNIYGSFNGYYSSMYDTTTTIDSNKYYHLTLVWNGSTQKFYINGVEKKSMNLGSIVKTLSATTSVGGEKDAAHRMMTGTVPLVKTYTRALSTQEILQNYNALKERFSL